MQEGMKLIERVGLIGDSILFNSLMLPSSNLFASFSSIRWVKKNINLVGFGAKALNFLDPPIGSCRSRGSIS